MRPMDESHDAAIGKTIRANGHVPLACPTFSRMIEISKACYRSAGGASNGMRKTEFIVALITSNLR